MTVLAKVSPEDAYVDLTSQGFTFGHSVPCPHCECHYRVLYEPERETPSVEAASFLAPSLEDLVANSHPEHPRRIKA